MLRGHVSPLAPAGVKIVGDYTDIMDKIVVDDWGQAHAGPFGALCTHVDSDRVVPRPGPHRSGKRPAGRIPQPPKHRTRRRRPTVHRQASTPRPAPRTASRHPGKPRIAQGNLRSSATLDKDNLYGELGEIVAGHKPGRESPDETTLFWHPGLSLSDIALGAAMPKKAEERGLGQKLRFS